MGTQMYFTTFENQYRSFRTGYPLPSQTLFKLTLACCVALLFTAVFYVISRPSPVEDSFFWELNSFWRNPYLLDTPNCRIFDTSLLTEDRPVVRKGYPRDVMPCPQLPPLSKVSRMPEEGHVYRLKLFNENFPAYLTTSENKSQGIITCCFMYIRNHRAKNATTNDQAYTNCTRFDRDVMLDPTFELVEVSCGTNVTLVYRKFHTLVTANRKVRRKMKSDKAKHDHSNWNERFSVMIIGVGSMSRTDFLRTMPETAEYLQAQGWVPLNGHSAVGVGLRENLEASVLAGLTGDQLDDECGHLCASPSLWEKYSEMGYITAYGEATVDRVNTVGSCANSSIDYNFSPTPISNSWNIFAMSKCSLSAQQQVLDFSLEFTSSFISHPTFSVFWSSVALLDPPVVDGLFRQYLENLADILNRTFVVFMSDTGKTYGDRRLEDMGFAESNLPVLYFWVPEDFRAEHPGEVKNLIENRNKLTSHFDLYLTLGEFTGTKSALGCPSCTSLFRPVPWTRTCAEAGIPRRFCSCLTYVKEPDATLSSHLGETLVQEINRRTEETRASDSAKCANLTLESASLRWTFPFAYSRQFAMDTTKLYLLSVRTIPEGAFEAMMYFNGTWKFDRILRLDDFGGRDCYRGNHRGFCVCNGSSGQQGNVRGPGGS